ncbi:MAG: type II secretion system protein J [Planctomycetaceae bacterium]
MISLRPKQALRSLVRRSGLTSGAPRAGVSLIELLIVMTALSVILTTSTVTLFRLLQAQTAGTRVLAESLSVSRLARDLRRDAHAARSAVLSTTDDRPTLTLTDSVGSTAIYRIVEGQLRRQSQRPNGTATQETYELGDVDITLALTEANRLVTIHLAPRPASAEEGTGLDHPLQHRRSGPLTIQAAILSAPPQDPESPPDKSAN